MGRKLNLSHLTEEECEQILKVIQKDFDLRQVEKERLASIEAKVEEEDARIKILATRQDFNEKYCLICFKKFLLFFTPKTRCSFCKHYLCKNCISFDIQLKADICSVCHKYHEFLQQSNSWFYKKVGTKFKRFGSAKIVRSLYKRKTDSDAESDSGYHPSVRESVSLSESMAKRSRPNLSKVFEIDEIKDSEATEEDEPVRTLSYYRHKLEAIERQIRKQFIEAKGDRHTGRGGSGSYDELMKQQTFNISRLLSAVTNELTSQLNETGDNNDQSKFRENRLGENAAKEAISKCVLEQCISHIYESSLPPNVDDDDHPFGIDPGDQSLQSYINQLSAAIVTKINVDLQSSEEKIFQEEEEEVRKELLKLSNRARMSQIGKHLSDSELEDLQVTTDSMSDGDGRDWQTRSQTDTLSANSSLRRPANERYFDESEYDVDENSIFAFASRKKGLVTLPGLDTPSPTRSADVDLELTAQTGSSSEDPWTLAERGPVAMMSNRIPIAPYDNYGKKKCGPAEAEGDLKIFLPKRPSVDGPMIGSMNVYELPDLSDGSVGSPFEEAPLDLEISVMKQHHPEIPEEHLEVSADSDECSLEPRFVSVPQDVAVNCGEALTCSCKLNGAKPINMFWYRDGDELIQLTSDERFTMSDNDRIFKIHLSNCELSDAGLYLCVAVNQHGTCQHRFTVKVPDKQTSGKNLLDVHTAGSVSYDNGKYQIGLTESKTNGLESNETNNSETLLENSKRFVEDNEKESKNLTSDATSSTSWRKELTTGIQGSKQPWNKTVMSSQDLDIRSESAEKLPYFDTKSSDNSSTTHGDKVTAASAVVLDFSSRVNGKEAIEDSNSSKENRKEDTETEADTNEFLCLHISQKKSTEDELRDVLARSDSETIVDDSAQLLREDHPNETDIKTTSLTDSKATEVRSLASSERTENSLSYEDHEKSNESRSKTAVVDGTTENDNKITTKVHEEHHHLRPNKDDITTSLDIGFNQTADGDYTRQVEDHIIDHHHQTYRNYENKPKIRSFYARSTDESMTKEKESPVTDKISQHTTDRDYRTSPETEIGTDTETMNKIKASEENMDTKGNSISGGHHEVSNTYEELSSARPIPNHLTSADNEIKEIAGNSENNWKPKISYTDTSTSGEVQTPQVVDCSPQNVDYKRYSREYDISNRHAFFEQKDKPDIMEGKMPTSPSHLAKRSQSSASESEVFTSHENSSVNATGTDLSSESHNMAQVSKKNVVDEISYTDTNTTGEVQIPQIVDCSPQNVDYRRYSREYDISDRRAFFEQKDKSDIMERKMSPSPSRLARRSQSSSSESEVFTTQAIRSVNTTSTNLSSEPHDMAQASKTNDLDEITLPSVKLLRLKFSTPPDTSSAEASIQRKRNSQTKLDSEPRWKSAEHAEKQFTSPRVPVSVVPLQPAPINSRSSSRPASRTDTTDFKSEPKFQREVILRPNVIKYSHTDSKEQQQQQPEPDEYLLQPQSASVAERVVIRPFYQRGNE